jgi:hypothetical protein
VGGRGGLPAGRRGVDGVMLWWLRVPLVQHERRSLARFRFWRGPDRPSVVRRPAPWPALFVGTFRIPRQRGFQLPVLEAPPFQHTGYCSELLPPDLDTASRGGASDGLVVLAGRTPSSRPLPLRLPPRWPRAGYPVPGVPEGACMTRRTRRSRLRRAAKWAGVGLCVAIVVTWITSIWWEVGLV